MNRINVSFNDYQMYSALKWCFENCGANWYTDEYDGERRDVTWRNRSNEEWIKYMSDYEAQHGESPYEEETAGITFVIEDDNKAMQFKLTWC